MGRDERGSATVLVLAMAGLLCFVGLALGFVAAAVVTQREAQSAADLAALAAASAVRDGNDACGAAADVAAANGASLTSCLVEGREVRVVLLVDGPNLRGRNIEIAAEARAGPT